MKKRFGGINRYQLPPSFYKFRDILAQFVPPFIFFQAIRTILFPTSVDVLILIILVALEVCFYFEWI
ncbi:hypothetical protein [Guptibacillus algicola]|uniref:hypothetical protein n=1 Tax=Guptibacillus algicola TaxID=225844 RepID=UPI001CD61CA4|nr:hypothetical protein [Alkalihalobacillus algicola]MCA0986236.1 hypothetical protein [Alkalihalobacillus algicola]